MGESDIMDCERKEFLILANKIESAISKYQHKTGRIVKDIKIEIQHIENLDKDVVRIKQLFIYTTKELGDV